MITLCSVFFLIFSSSFLWGQQFPRPATPLPSVNQIAQACAQEAEAEKKELAQLAAAMYQEAVKSGPRRQESAGYRQKLMNDLEKMRDNDPAIYQNHVKRLLRKEEQS